MRKVRNKLYILYACISHSHKLALDIQRAHQVPTGAQKSRVDPDRRANF